MMTPMLSSPEEPPVAPHSRSAATSPKVFLSPYVREGKKSSLSSKARASSRPRQFVTDHHEDDDADAFKEQEEEIWFDDVHQRS
mmetsp:Transcript_12861/g.25748  ORF Transcript_12861/g.25748 Transcript_12861/m.25748 type:complete len:84 (-) Transcript_12861:286-537(-)